MAFIRLREIRTGDYVIFNTEQITRASSFKNESPGGVIKSARVLRVEVAGSTRPSECVPVDDAGEQLPFGADDESVVRGFAAFLAASTRTR